MQGIFFLHCTVYTVFETPCTLLHVQPKHPNNLKKKKEHFTHKTIDNIGNVLK